jgi:hypothetical protein
MKFWTFSENAVLPDPDGPARPTCTTGFNIKTLNTTNM